MKKFILSLILNWISELTKLISKLEARLQNSPNGILLCRKKKGRYYFFLKQGCKETYLKNDDVRIARYAQSQYLSRKLIAAKREKKQFEDCAHILTSRDRCADIDDVYNSLNDGVKAYVHQDSDTTDGYVENWLKKMQKSIHRGYPEEAKIISMDGTHVRSKSEALIADRLFLAGIPYAYEVQTYLENGDKKHVFPDFTILDRKTRKTIIWEHFGKMDSPNYFSEVVNKLKIYEQNNYYLGVNFFVTFESSNSPLDTEYVDMIIKNHLL